MTELMLCLLLLCSFCGVGLGVVAVEYLDDVQAREAVYMKYGICVQIWGFILLCLLYMGYGNDLFVALMPMLALGGAGLFMLGVVAVMRQMPKAGAVFCVLSAGVQVCVVTFLVLSASMLS